VGAAWSIVDWGRIFNNLCRRELAGNRIRVGENSPVGWSLHQTEIENSFDLCRQKCREMKVQDTLEMVQIRAFPHIPTSGQLAHDTISKTILVA